MKQDVVQDISNVMLAIHKVNFGPMSNPGTKLDGTLIVYDAMSGVVLGKIVVLPGGDPSFEALSDK